MSTVPDSHGTLRPLLRLVWPVLAEQLLVMFVGLSDTFLAGRYLSRSHLAAMTSVSYLMWLLTNLFAVVAIGATALTAHHIGRHDLRGAVRATNQSLLLGGVLAVILTVLGCLFAQPLLGLMRLEGEAAEFAHRFLTFLVPVLPAMMIESVGIAALRGAGDMVTGLVTMILVNVVNLAVSWSLVGGIGPIPPQGWDAIAIGTATGHAVGGLVVLALLVRGRYGFRVRLWEMRPDAEMIRRILWVGVPGGIDVISLTVCRTRLPVDDQSSGSARCRSARRGDPDRIAGISAGGSVSSGCRDAGRAIPGRPETRTAPAAWSWRMRRGHGDDGGPRRVDVCGRRGIGELLPESRADRRGPTRAPLLRIISTALVPLAIMNVLTGTCAEPAIRGCRWRSRWLGSWAFGCRWRMNCASNSAGAWKGPGTRWRSICSSAAHSSSGDSGREAGSASRFEFLPACSRSIRSCRMPSPDLPGRRCIAVNR